MKQTFIKAMILVTVILMDILGGAELDIFVPSFPELQTQFNLSTFLVEALLSVNFIGFCLSLFFVGGLADRYGRKPIILLGIIIFIIGSIFCLRASSYKLLLIGRFLQGIGVAAPATLYFLIITDLYPIRQQQYLIAMMNGLMNTAVGVAPVVGSYITMYFHWQGNFTALLLLGLVVLVMTIIFIPTNKNLSRKEAISLSGYIPIFKSKPLMLLIANIVFMGVPYWIFVGMSPILYIKDLGVSLSHFGYYQGSLALVFALGSILSGFIISKYDQKRMLYIASHIFILTLISIALVTFFNSPNPLFITLAFIPFIICGSIHNTILYPICFSFMPHAKGKVSALIQGVRLILMAVGIELAGYYYSGSFRSVGIVIIAFVFIAIVTLFFVIKNRRIMEFSKL